MLWILIYAYCRQRHLMSRWCRTQASLFFCPRRTACKSWHFLSFTSFTDYVWHLQMTKHKIATLPNTKFQQGNNYSNFKWNKTFVNSKYFLYSQLIDNCFRTACLWIRTGPYNTLFKFYIVTFYLSFNSSLCYKSNDHPLVKRFELTISLAVMECCEDKSAHTQSAPLCSRM